MAQNGSLWLTQKRCFGRDSFRLQFFEGLARIEFTFRRPFAPISPRVEVNDVGCGGMPELSSSLHRAAGTGPGTHRVPQLREHLHVLAREIGDAGPAAVV